MLAKEDKDFILKQCEEVSSIEDISDGYHTFESLYRQRLYLWVTIINMHLDKAWKTIRHEDGNLCFGGGWFLVGLNTPAGQYSYHYPLEYWDLFKCASLVKAPKFDGHTDKDVTRLLSL